MSRNYRIIDQGNHLRVEFSGSIGFGDIAAAIREQAGYPGFNQRNDIWVFRDVEVDIQFEDLDDLTDLIARINQDGGVSARTAVVADAGFNAAVGQMWLQTARNLPWEIEIFEDEDEALAWIGA